MTTPTHDEFAIIGHLAQAWNVFVELPEIHPSDAREFEQAIHQAQNIILARATVRALGWEKVMRSRVTCEEITAARDSGVLVET